MLPWDGSFIAAKVTVESFPIEPMVAAASRQQRESTIQRAMTSVYEELWRSIRDAPTREQLVIALRNDDDVIAHGGDKGFLAELINEFEVCVTFRRSQRYRF